MRRCMESQEDPRVGGPEHARELEPGGGDESGHGEMVHREESRDKDDDIN